MKQSLSLSYALKKKSKKMADGGEVEAKETKQAPVTPPNTPKQPLVEPGNPVIASIRRNFGYAEGGEIEDEHMMPEDEMHGEQDDAHMLEMIGHIMKKRKMMSEGGKVANGGEDDLDKMADGKPNEFDDLALRDDLDSSYTGSNSGDELGNEREDHDRADIISKIMSSRRKKDRMPHPA